MILYAVYYTALHRFGSQTYLDLHSRTCGLKFECSDCSAQFPALESLQTHCRRKAHQAADTTSLARIDTYPCWLPMLTPGPQIRPEYSKPRREGQLSGAANVGARAGRAEKGCVLSIGKHLIDRNVTSYCWP